MSDRTNHIQGKHFQETEYKIQDAYESLESVRQENHSAFMELLAYTRNNLSYKKQDVTSKKET